MLLYLGYYALPPLLSVNQGAQLLKLWLHTQLLPGIDCDRQLDSHEQSKDDGAGIEGHKGGKPQVPEVRGWGGNLILRVAFPPQAYRWS